jgi:acyl-CoA dehydrogenase
VDFDLTERQAHFRDRVRAFIERHVRPPFRASPPSSTGRPLAPPEGLEPLKEGPGRGLWNLFMPPGGALQHVDESFAFEGEQLTNLEYALCAEEMGRVGWASEVFNCSAPDTGNMEVLHRYGTREQKEQWLAPLMRGEIRSAFLMTEPGSPRPTRPTSSARSAARATNMSSTAANGGRRARAIRAARSPS